MKYFSYQAINFYGFVFIMALLIFAYYLQVQLGLQPCPLCIMQRFIFTLIGFVFFCGIFFRPKSLTGRRSYGLIIFILSLIGLGMAGRQVYLQHLPASQAPACGPGLYVLMKNLPFHQAVKLLFLGSGDCAEVHWRFIDLSMAEWSLLAFILFAGISIFQMARK